MDSWSNDIKDKVRSLNSFGKRTVGDANISLNDNFRYFIHSKKDEELNAYKNFNDLLLDFSEYLRKFCNGK